MGSGWPGGWSASSSTDTLQRRQQQFKARCYDRTVHPTQMYSLPAEQALDAIVTALLAQQPVAPPLIEQAAQALTQEYLGRNVSIASAQEADEILLDLATLITAEEYSELYTGAPPAQTLRPRLSVLLERLGRQQPAIGPGAPPAGSGRRGKRGADEPYPRPAAAGRPRHSGQPRAAVTDSSGCPSRISASRSSWTRSPLLTHQLEQRYRGILPLSLEVSAWRQWAMRWHLRRDPAHVLWQHNDRYERKMLELRRQRRTMLEHYLALNKQLRQQLRALIPAIQAATAPPLRSCGRQPATETCCSAPSSRRASTRA